MTTPAPTQTRHPRRATFRTFLQQLVGWVVAAGVVLPAALAIVQTDLGDVIPPAAMEWIVLVVGVAVAVSTAAAKIMAIPQVDAFLRRHQILSLAAAAPPLPRERREYEYPEFPGDEQEG